MVKKGDLVRYEYLTRHHSGIGWQFHKGIGIVVQYNRVADSYVIMTEMGNLVERLDMQIESINKGEERDKS